MKFHPGIIALLLGSLLTASLLCYAAWYGVRIIKSWDLNSGSEVQLELERRTYLISMVMGYVLGFQLLSLFLFIYTADAISPLFVGAMCAAGSLKVNAFGYPTVILKLVNFLLGGVWLIINFTDNKACDYPLIKVKYWLLLSITPFLVAEAILQGSYLFGLKPNIITSCCGILFSEGSENVVGDLTALPRTPSQLAFAASIALTLSSGLYFYTKGQGAYIFSAIGVVTFMISMIAIISFISIYFYELPTHHCPFCILQKEYGYVGYAIYSTLLLASLFGLGSGSLEPFRKIKGLNDSLPRIQRKLCFMSLLFYTFFSLIVGFGMLLSNLSLAAY